MEKVFYWCLIVTMFLTFFIPISASEIPSLCLFLQSHLTKKSNINCLWDRHRQHCSPVKKQLSLFSLYHPPLTLALSVAVWNETYCCWQRTRFLKEMSTWSPLAEWDGWGMGELKRFGCLKPLSKSTGAHNNLASHSLVNTSRKPHLKGWPRCNIEK